MIFSIIFALDLIIFANICEYLQAFAISFRFLSFDDYVTTFLTRFPLYDEYENNNKWTQLVDTQNTQLS